MTTAGPASRPARAGCHACGPHRPRFAGPDSPLIRTSDRPAAAREIGSSRDTRSEEHTSELQSRPHLVCRLLLEKKKTTEAYAVTCDQYVLTRFTETVYRT